MAVDFKFGPRARPEFIMWHNARAHRIFMGAPRFNGRFFLVCKWQENAANFWGKPFFLFFLGLQFHLAEKCSEFLEKTFFGVQLHLARTCSKKSKVPGLRAV